MSEFARIFNHHGTGDLIPDNEVGMLETALSLETEVDDRILDLVESVRDHAEVTHEITKAHDLHAGLDYLIAQTMDDYSTSGMSTEAAELFGLSIEAVFRTSGISMPRSMITASFELAEGGTVLQRTYSRGQAILKSVAEFIMTLYARLSELAKIIIAKLRNSKTATEGYLKAVVSKVSRNTNQVPKRADVDLGGAADYLLDRSGKVAHPSNIVTMNVDMYGDFIAEWEGNWRKILGLPIPMNFDSGAATALTQQLRDLGREAVVSSNLDIRFILSHHLQIKPGAGNNVVLGAKLLVEKTAKARTSVAPTMTRNEIGVGITAVTSSFKVLGEVERKIDGLVRDSGNFAGKVKSLKAIEVSESEAAGVREAIKAMSKAATLASDGYTETLPLFMKSIKACIKYMDASANEYLRGTNDE